MGLIAAVLAALGALLSFPSPAEAAPKPWRLQVEALGRTLVAAPASKALKTAAYCRRGTLKTCAKAIHRAILPDCRLQGMTARRLAASIKRAARASRRVLIVTESGGYPWRCEAIPDPSALRSRVV